MRTHAVARHAANLRSAIATIIESRGSSSAR
jgi:hypothetical protein